MKVRNKKIWLFLLFISTMIIAYVMLVRQGENETRAPGKAVHWFKQNLSVFVTTTIALRKKLGYLSEGDTSALAGAKEALKKCRLQYKRTAFFLEYFFPEQALLCNGPPQAEIESSRQEYRDPAGLQVIESILFSPHPSGQKNELEKQADLLTRTAENILSLMGDFEIKDDELLASLNLEIIRIITLYITGYDAPLLKSGIAEAHESLSTIDTLLAPFIKDDTRKDSIEYYLTAGTAYLQQHTDFDSFNRLFFITSFALPLQGYLNELVSEKNKGQKVLPALNLHTGNLFSPGAINRQAFPGAEEETSPLFASLGKRLFFETALSANNTRSCASCHSPKAFFADGLHRNKTLEGSSDLPRNTPGLLYACYQYVQFWDGRVQSLEQQAGAVLSNKTEMGVPGDTVVKRLTNNAAYATAFRQAWPAGAAISLQHVETALAAYVRTLTPFQSVFDSYMNGDSNALSMAQQRGFNLFMGKARCGTCHFAPLFNGLLPPRYQSTEFEVLGTPANDNFEKPITDTDMGRYNFFPVTQNKRTFKTPGIRNAAVTFPYMHNGEFTTLEKVIDFYDKGGGTGIGLKVPNQTLLEIPLRLSKQEKEDLLDFIKALTDKSLKFKI